MKKLFGVVVLVVLVIGAVKAYGHWSGRSERHACAKIADLCGADDVSSSDLDECVADVDKLPTAEADKGIACVNESSSCAEAAGCIMGVVNTAIDKQVKKFETGFERGKNK